MLLTLCGRVSAGMVRKDGTGSEFGADVMTSSSSMLRRDRGRLWSPVDRMKGSLERRPPDVLRLRVGADGLELPTSGESAGTDGGVWSIAKVCSGMLLSKVSRSDAR